MNRLELLFGVFGMGGCFGSTLQTGRDAKRKVSCLSDEKVDNELTLWQKQGNLLYENFVVVGVMKWWLMIISPL